MRLVALHFWIRLCYMLGLDMVGFDWMVLDIWLQRSICKYIDTHCFAAGQGLDWPACT